MRLLLTLVAAVGLAAGVGAPAAGQQPQAETTFDSGGSTIGLSAADGNPPTVGGRAEVSPSADAPTARPIRVIDQSHDDPGGCPRSPDGRRVLLRYVFTDTYESAGITTYCFGFRPAAPEVVPADPTAPPVVLPPPPPSAQEVADAVAFPTAEIALNPDARGVTGLETWLWWEGADEVATSVSLGGWTGTVSAEIVAIQWAMGNGDVVTASGTGGSEANPLATYVYQRRCDCELTATVTWGGTFELTNPLTPIPYTASLGTVDVSVTRPYEVVSIEAVGSG